MRGAAKFSDDRYYRYVLGRFWGNCEVDMPVTWIMLNPSTASATRNDPTIRKCIQFSHHWGYDSLYVVNLFAKRSSDPKDLLLWDDPVGPDNDKWICWAVKKSPTVVLAWGSNGWRWQERVKEVLKLISPRESRCLGYTNHGHPRHPLMLSYKTKLVYYGKD